MLTGRLFHVWKPPDWTLAHGTCTYAHVTAHVIWPFSSIWCHHGERKMTDLTMTDHRNYGVRHWRTKTQRVEIGPSLSTRATWSVNDRPSFPVAPMPYWVILRCSDLPANEDLTGRQWSRLHNDGTRHKDLVPMISAWTKRHSLGTRSVTVVIVGVDRGHAEPIRHTLRTHRQTHQSVTLVTCTTVISGRATMMY